MSEDFSALFKLQDMMSAQANNMADAIAKLDKKLHSAEDAATTFNKHVGKTAQIMKAGQGGWSAMGGAMGMVASGALKIVEGLGKMIGPLMQHGVEFAKYVGHATDFRQSSERVMTTLLGTRGAATQLLGELGKLANNAGLPTEKVYEFSRQLKNAGFAAEQVKDVLFAGADADKLLGAGSMEKIIEQMQTLRKGGHASLDTLQGMFGLDKLKAAFGVAQSTSETAFKAIFEGAAGQGNRAINSLFKAVVTAGGGKPLGAAAFEAASNSFGDQLTILQNNFSKLFSGSGKEAGPFVGILKSINSLFDVNTSQGKAFKEVMDGLLGALSGGLGELFSAKNIKLIGDALIDAGKSIRDLFATWNSGGDSNGFMKAIASLIKMFPAAIALGMVFIDVIAWIVNKMVSFVEWFDKGSAGATAFKVALGVLALATAPIIAGVGLIAAAVALMCAPLIAAGLAVKAIIDYFSSQKPKTLQRGLGQQNAAADAAKAAAAAPPQDLVTGYPQVMNAAGQNVTLGYAAGIRAGIPEVRLANEAMAKAGITQTQVTTDSHSPSRKYMKLGAWSAAGYGLGFEQEAANTNDMIAAAVQPPDMSSDSGSSGGGARRGVTVIMQPGAIVIQITGAEDPRAAGEAAADAFLRKLERAAQGAAEEAA